MKIKTSTKRKRSSAITAGWVILLISWAVYLLPIPLLSSVVGMVFGGIAFITSVVVLAKGYAGPGFAQIIVNVIGTPIVYTLGIAIAVGSYADDAPSQRPQVTTKRRAPVSSNPLIKSISFSRNCVLRETPKGRKLGSVKANEAVRQIDRRGSWRHVELQDGRKGWCGCKIAF